MCQIVEDYLAEGYSKTTSCAKLDINRDTLYAWIKKHADFSDAIDRGMAKGQAKFEKLLIDKVSNKNNSTHENLLMFTLKTRYKDIYSDRQEVMTIATPEKIIINRAD